MLKSSGAEIPRLLFRQDRPLRRLYVNVLDVLEQLRNRVERGLAFLHTTAHQPTALEVDAFVELDERLVDVTRRIVGQMMGEVVLILELVVAIVPVALEHFEKVSGSSA